MSRNHHLLNSHHASINADDNTRGKGLSLFGKDKFILLQNELQSLILTLSKSVSQYSVAWFYREKINLFEIYMQYMYVALCPEKWLIKEMQLSLALTVLYMRFMPLIRYTFPDMQITFLGKRRIPHLRHSHPYLGMSCSQISFRSSLDTTSEFQAGRTYGSHLMGTLQTAALYD